MSSHQRDFQHRYARHLALPQVGERGQARLADAHVCLIGLGGLGAIIAPYLAAAGVGELTLLDFDEVSLSNLQRQPLYTMSDLGRPKVEVAKERLRSINPEVKVNALSASLEELIERGDALERLRGVSALVDATDRFSARALICSLAHQLGCPHVYGSVNGFEGQVALFTPQGPCYRCLFPELPTPGLIQNCSQAGVLGPAPAMIGASQALLTLHALLGLIEGAPFTQFDLLTLKSYQLPLLSDPRCPECHVHSAQQGVKLKLTPRALPLSARALQSRLKAGWAPLIIDVRSEAETALGVIEGSALCPLDQLLALLKRVELESSERAGLMSTPRAEHSPALAQHEGCAQTGRAQGELTQAEGSDHAPQELVVYCAHGPRAERALTALSDLSAHALQLVVQQLSPDEAHLISAPTSPRLWELVGGWSAWRELGLGET